MLEFPDKVAVVSQWINVANKVNRRVRVDRVCCWSTTNGAM